MKVQELLDKPEKWTQGAYARNHNKAIVSSRDVEAVCWCLLGAVYRCYPEAEDNDDIVIKIINKLPNYVTDWNDEKGRTYDEVLALCKELDI